MRVRIASRRSDLARLQAYLVGERISQANAQIEIEYQFKESMGDINLTDPLWKAPEKGVFTEDFYSDLAQERCDLVVHSWKDLPIVEKELTFVAGTLSRADARDVLLFKKSSLSQKSRRLRFLSSSPRRNYNLSSFFKWSLPFAVDSVTFESVRGNIPTRIKRFLESSADGLIVAKAALDRLCSSTNPEFLETKKLILKALESLEFQVIPHSANPPCAGQGALAIECRRNDAKTIELIQQISTSTHFSEVQLERSILKSYGGGCHQKIGVWVKNKDFGQIQILKGLTEDGQILDVATLLPRQALPKIPFSKLISLGDLQKNERCDLKSQAPSADGWIITRANSLPTDWKVDNKYIWAAGSKTWKNLSLRGVWVHGSFDGLGEESIELGFANPNWVKLSHNSADSAIYPVFKTYSIEFGAIESEWVDEKACYFWRSFAQYSAAIQQQPRIEKAWHACGPGSTYEKLKNCVKPERLFAFLDESDWKNQCQMKI